MCLTQHKLQHWILRSLPKPLTPKSLLSHKKRSQICTYSCTCPSKCEKSCLVSTHAVVHQHCQAQLFSPANIMIILKNILLGWGEQEASAFFSSQFSLPGIHTFLFTIVQHQKGKKKYKHNSFYISACDINATLLFQAIQDTPESLSLKAVKGCNEIKKSKSNVKKKLDLRKSFYIRM